MRILVITSLLLQLMGCGRRVENLSEGSRLRVLALTGEGAVEVAAGWWDNDLKIACAFVELSAGKARCLPTSALVDFDRFSDSGCTARVVVQPPGSCSMPPPRHILADHGGGATCREPTYHELGAEVATPERLYSIGGNGRCQERNEPVPAGRYFGYGALVEIGRFASGTIKDEKRGARLVSHTVVSADGARQELFSSVAQEAVFDSELGVDCMVGDANDTSKRCLPANAQDLGNYYFADAACQQSAAPVYVDACHPAATPKHLLRWPEIVASTPCHTGPEVYGLGNGLADLYVRPGAGNCNADPNFDPPDDLAYAIGSRVPDASLVKFDPVADGRSSPLELVRLRSADGTVLMRGELRDRKRAAACTPTFAGGKEGKLEAVCLPSRNGTIFFSDSGCTQTVARRADNDQRGCNPSSPYAVDVRRHLCPQQVKVYRLGPEIARPEHVYYFAADGSCVEGPNHGHFFAIAGEEALSSFPGLTLEYPIK